MNGLNQTPYFGQKAKLSPSLFFSQSLLKNLLIASCLNFICLFELILQNIKKLGEMEIIKISITSPSLVYSSNQDFI